MVSNGYSLPRFHKKHSNKQNYNLLINNDSSTKQCSSSAMFRRMDAKQHTDAVENMIGTVILTQQGHSCIFRAVVHNSGPFCMSTLHILYVLFNTPDSYSAC